VIRQALVEKRVAEVLLDARQFGPPVNLDEICKRAGVALRRGVQMLGRQQAHYDKARQEISITAERYGRAERFSIAHELGHALMNHGTPECYLGSVSVDSMPLDEADMGVKFESEANAFASELLIKRDWLKKAILEDEMPLSELMSYFDSTKPVLIIAISNTAGLLDKVRP
jgi:Zn-dependent peptidase ImmA (M78 family)